MKEELESALCKEFPSIFRDYHGDMTVTCMHWGMSCGDGWASLIRDICLYINNSIENAKSNVIFEYKKKNKIDYSVDLSTEILKELKIDDMIVVADQVKEKFGGLRFYWHSENLPEDSYQRISGAIDMAEMRSEDICEECGERGDMRGPGWFFTACDKHAKDRKTLKEYQAFEDEQEKKNKANL